MAWYPISFRVTDTALDPVFVRFEKLADGVAIPNPPAIVAIGHGLYRFSFAPTEDVVFVVDGGLGIDDPELRYVRGILSPQDDRLDAAMSSRATPADVGTAAAGVISAVSTRAAATDLATLITSLTGRWRIDPNTKQLTLYQADGTTPWKVFDLLDAQGQPNSTQPAERRPVVAPAGLTAIQVSNTYNINTTFTNPAGLGVTVEIVAADNMVVVGPLGTNGTSVPIVLAANQVSGTYRAILRCATTGTILEVSFSYLVPMGGP